MFTVQEVAKDLKVHEVTVRRWIKAGDLAAIQLPGGDYRIAEEEYEKLVRRIITTGLPPTELPPEVAES